MGLKDIRMDPSELIRISDFSDDQKIMQHVKEMAKSNKQVNKSVQEASSFTGISSLSGY